MEEDKESLLSKVPGFRSGKAWKKVVASMGYLFIAFTLLGAILGDDIRQVPPAVVDKAQDTKKSEQQLNTLEQPNQEEVAAQAYITELTQNTQDWSKALTTFGELFSNPQLDDEDWTLKVGVLMTTMNELVEKAEKITPPKKYKGMHATYMKGIRDYKWVADNIPTAVENLDADLMKLCAYKLMLGNRHIAQATAKVNDLES